MSANENEKPHLVFPGFELLDLFGPLEMFGLVDDGFRIRIVSESGGPVASSHGPQTLADSCFDDEISYDILLIPGGGWNKKGNS